MTKKAKDKQLSLFSIEPSQLRPLNFSTISIFQRCPLEYKYRYFPRNMKFDPRGNEILLGRALHSFTSSYLSKLQNERKKQFNLEEEWVPFEKYFPNNNQKYHDILIEAFDHILKGSLSQLTILATEYSFKTTFDNFILTGRVDCVSRDKVGDLIIDFKLNPLEFSYHTSQVSRFLQLIFYYVAIKDSMQLGFPRLAYYFFSDGSFDIMETNDELISMGVREIQRLDAEREKAKQFYPNKTYFCLTCNVKRYRLCPLWKKNINGCSD